MNRLEIYGNNTIVKPPDSFRINKLYLSYKDIIKIPVNFGSVKKIYFGIFDFSILFNKKYININASLCDSEYVLYIGNDEQFTLCENNFIKSKFNLEFIKIHHIHKNKKKICKIDISLNQLINFCNIYLRFESYRQMSFYFNIS
jgi:hypothetical protein